MQKYHLFNRLIIGEIRLADLSICLKLDFNIALWLTTTGQDLASLDKCQRLLLIADLAFQQAQAAGATIARAALVFDGYLMIFKRF